MEDTVLKATFEKLANRGRCGLQQDLFAQNHFLVQPLQTGILECESREPRAFLGIGFMLFLHMPTREELHGKTEHLQVQMRICEHRRLICSGNGRNRACRNDAKMFGELPGPNWLLRALGIL